MAKSIVSKEDRRAYKAAYYLANRERCLARGKLRVAANRDQIKEYKAAWYVKNRARCNAKDALNYANNRDERKAQMSDWGRANRKAINADVRSRRALDLEKARAREAVKRIKNRGKIRASNAKYHAKHKEKINARHSAWMSRNLDKHRAKQARRRAIKRGVTIGDRSAIAAIYRRATSSKLVRCYLCDKKIPVGQRHVDHIIPLKRGGEHSVKNLAIACVGCNLNKRAKLLSEIGWLPFST